MRFSQGGDLKRDKSNGYLALRGLGWLALAIGLLLTDRHTRYTEPVRLVLSAAADPFEYMAAMPYRFGHWLQHSLSDRYELLSENRTLREEVLRLQVSLQNMVVLKTENQKLKSLLNAAERLDTDRYRLAQVVQVKANAYKKIVVINQGAARGVYVGQPVIDAYGVLGQVVSVGLWSAKVLLLSDSDSALPVFSQRSGVRAILTGQGEATSLALQHVPDTANIAVGDLLLTSGMGGRFPVGYPVGTVRKIVRHPGAAFAKVEVAPAAHMDRGHLVMLVWQNSKAKPKDQARGSEEKQKS